jgi:arsenite-transporting ATPase
LEEAASVVSASDEFKSNGNPSPITITELPFFDVELIGVPALGYIGSQQLADNPSFQHLMEDDKSDEAKVVICGGKGGVGKSKFEFSGVSQLMRKS